MEEAAIAASVSRSLVDLEFALLLLLLNLCCEAATAPAVFGLIK